MMTRLAVLPLWLCAALLAHGQGDKQLRAKADALFAEERFAEALPLYSQLVSLEPGDRTLNYRYGTCVLHGGGDREKAIGFLKYAAEDPAIPALVWYWLGRAYHLNYRFSEALNAYQRFRGTGDERAIAAHPVDALEQQCRNGQQLLNSLKEISVHSKVEVEDREFFRYYDLEGIGGRIVVTPDELKTPLDKKYKGRSLIHLPDKPGPIYFGSYGRDGRNGRDIYRTELLPNGTFAAPVRLAGFINTDQDEDFPFMHPDGKSFYFASKGHNSMGGYDIFKSTYDPGMDVFGRPENLDFAVNTPDDDLFYIVDGEGRQACFASARSSSQDMLHVYRVSTEQVPVVLTVLRGTFASAYDPQDRKAHIVVEDGLTREVVADVRTDIDGSYLISLPRSGRYRFLVEAGPSGRTHAGVVEVPRSDGPRAYRQELKLEDQGGQERLVIRNYFEDPLDGDLVAMALDEIKRRARLDVGMATAAPPVAQEQAPRSIDQLMNEAGFTGDRTAASVVAQLQRTAQQEEARVKALADGSGAAFTLAQEAVLEAERSAARADDLLREARQTTDTLARDRLMGEAAVARARAQDANTKARAAVQTGQDLDAERMATAQQAQRTAALGTELGAALEAGKADRTLPLLVKAREMEEAAKGASDRPDLVERSRRAVTEKDLEASRALAAARSKSSEESELRDRIGRLERELAEAKGKTRQDQVRRELDEQREQLGHLGEEVARANTRARTAVTEVETMRTRSELVSRLVENPGTRPATALDPAAVEALGGRIAQNVQRIGDLAIDERFSGTTATAVAEQPGARFDWQMDQATAQAATQARNGTGTAERTTADQATARTITAPGGRTQQADPVSVTQPAGTGVAQEGVHAPVQDERTASAATTSAPGAAPEPTTAAGTVAPPAAGGAVRPDGTPVEGTARPAGTGDAGPGTVATTTAERPAEGAVRADQAAQAAAGAQQSAASAGQDRPTPQQIREGGGATGNDLAQEQQPEGQQALPVEQQRFVLENEVAELQQLRAATRDRDEREALTARIAQLRGRIDSLDAVVAAERIAAQAPTQRVDSPEVAVVAGTALELASDLTDAQVIELLNPGHAADAARLEAIPDLDERVDALGGLSAMLVDSIDVQVQRQLKLLEREPARSAEVLPRVDRLRVLKATEQARMDRLRAEAMRSDLLIAAVPDREAGQGTPTAGVPAARTEEGRYVSVAGRPTAVYASRLNTRASTVTEAVALRDKDLAEVDRLQLRIDSLEAVLDTVQDKMYDRVRREADRAIDDQLILRTDLGQRMAYITREELRTGRDSLKELQGATDRLGLAPDEPLLALARSEEGSSRTFAAEGERLRKLADRSEDIVARDSLYRLAYTAELQALAALDRAITAQAYIQGDRFRRGEALSMAEVEARMFGPATAVAQVPMREPGAQAAPEPGSAAPTETARVDTIAAADPGARVATVPADSVVRDDGARQDLAAERPAPGTEGRTQQQEALPTGAQAAGANTQRPVVPIDPAGQARYTAFLNSDTLPASGMSMLLVEDETALGAQARETLARAQADEQRSVALGDSAVALRDSAMVARRKVREALEREALRLQVLSDSLQQAALRSAEDARALEQHQRDVAEAKAFADKLRAYYYLSSEEQQLVMDNTDRSRYFQAKVKAMEQREAATDALEEEAAYRTLSQALVQEAAAAEARSAGAPADTVRARIEVMRARAVELGQRGDSLSAIAQRLKGAATLNDGQAALYLQQLNVDTASRIMALEQRTRRVEPLLAEVRAGQVPGPVSAPVAPPAREEARTTAAQGTSATVPVAVPVAPTAEGLRGLQITAEPLRRDVFSMATAPLPRATPIPMEQPLPAGLVFSVQIGAFRDPVPQHVFSDLAPVTGERTTSGLVRYTAGLFTRFEAADEAKASVRGRGYRDAFVVAFLDGRRIPLAEARRWAMAQAGPAVAATDGRVPGGTVAQQAASTTTSVVTAPEPTPPPAVVVERPTQLQPAAPDTTQVLAKYPATAAEVMAQFQPPSDAAAYYNDPSAAPARQVEVVKGLFFTVQVGVYSKPVALDKLFNITPLNSESIGGGRIRYTTGIFRDLDVVRMRRDEAVGKGVKDAFITAYLNGRRIPVAEARALLQRFGAEVLVDPSLVTP
ncbi:MAG: PD40 domain-containing protein [Flavobacteriales bacterium]|nr:PD40 domain-containing protein [Flavobacteriales bacterium]